MSSFDMDLAKKYSKEYCRASKKRKSDILNEYCSLTETNRNTAVQRLKRTKLKSKYPVALKSRAHKKRGRKKVFIEIHKIALKRAWELSGKLCAELMYPELVNYLNNLANAGELRNIPSEELEVCKRISLGSLKNVLREFPNPVKRNYKSKSHIYSVVPIDANFRRFTTQPGNFEVDYVESNGGNSGGRFAITGTYVDLYSQWTTRAAGWGKNLESIKRICELTTGKVFHPIYRIHPDNCPSTLQMLTERAVAGGRLANVDVSRSRPYKKNDNAHVEQKNGDKVRKLIGHWRLDTEEAVKLLNELYDIEDLISNFFTPCMKLHCKLRNERGVVTKKIFQHAATPYARLMRSHQIPEEVKNKMKDIKLSLNLVELRKRSDIILESLKDEMH